MNIELLTKPIKILGEDHLILGFVSVLAWCLLYVLIKITLHRLPRSKTLSNLTITVISEASVSAIQGVVCGSIGIYAIFCCRQDVMNEKSELLVYYCTIGTGYFIYDLVSMYYSNLLGLSENEKMDNWTILKSYLKNNALMIAHHIILTAVLFPALITYSPMGHFFAGCFFSMELSSPFVNIRIMLSRLQMKQTNYYFINGVTMMIVFALCRVIVFPYMYFVYVLWEASVSGSSYLYAFLKIPIICHCCCALLLAPQIYWLILMMKGVRAAVLKRLRKTKKSE